MSFIESPRFPDIIALGSRGGPEYSTSVIVVNSGKEFRKQRWSFPKHSYSIGAGAKASSEIDELREFHHSMRGRFNGFRFKDFNDFSSAADMDTAVTNLDQIIGTGDGATATFQLVKIYATSDSPSLPLTRNITKPVVGTVVVAVATVGQTLGVDFTVDTTTGIITFISSPLPTGQITAGYQFDVPVRFTDDNLQVEQISPGVERATIGMIELL